MDMSDEVSAYELLQAHELIWNCTYNYIKPMSLKCAIELGIPDIIHNHGKPITLSNLISELPIHPSKSQCVLRLMRILVHYGFFTTQKGDTLEQEEEEEAEEDDKNQYSLTLVSRLLLKDGPLRATPFVHSLLNPLLVTPTHSLSAWLQSSEPTPFEMVNGMSFWDGVGSDPVLNPMFTDAMANDSHIIAKIVVDQCQNVFEGMKSLVDVGGGTGIMAKAIAKAFPSMKCTVLDLPYIVANAQGTNNLSFIEGDMFKDVPRTNAILLKWILHDWNDEETLTILKNCREAIDWSKDEGGKVIIIDMVVGQSQSKPPYKTDKKSIETQLCFDMVMMINLTGKERNQKEWESLFYAAGFSHYKISPIVGLRSLIEVYP